MVVDTGSVKVAIVNAYLACHSGRRPQHYDDNISIINLVTKEINHLTEKGFTILIMGDLNSRVGDEPPLGIVGNDKKVNENCRILKQFVRENGLVIIISLPLSQGLFTRRTMDHDKGKLVESVLDALMRDVHMINSFVVDEFNRYAITSDHSTIVIEIKLTNGKQTVTWRVRNDWCIFSDEDNIEAYQEALNSNSINIEEYRQLTTEDKLEHLKKTIKSSWMGSNSKPKRGRGVKRNEANIVVTLIPRLKQELEVNS